MNGTSRRHPRTGYPIIYMSKGERAALPTEPQAFDESLGASPWWREGDLARQYTGRFGPYGYEVRVRHIVTVGE